MKDNDIIYEYIEDFVYNVADTVLEDKDIFVTVVAKFEEMKEIIKELMTCYDVNFEIIDIQSPIMNGYNDEYVLDLWCHNNIIQIQFRNK